MKISTKSWHYRFLDKCDVMIPTDLCSYVRKLVLCLGGVAALVAMLSFIASTLIVAPLVWFGIVYGAKESLIETMAVLGTGFWTIWTLVALIAGLKALSDRRSARAYDSRFREPGVVRSYLRAKKQKICPLIEYD